MINKTWIIGIVIVVAASFGIAWANAASDLTAREFVAWVENPTNGLVAAQSNGDFEVELRFRPETYNVILGAQSASQALELYELRIAPTGVPGSPTKQRNAERLNDNIAHLYGSFQDDLEMVAGKDTLECGLYLLQPTMGLTPYTSVLIGFEKPTNSNADRSLFIQSTVLDLTAMELSLSADALQNIPTLNISGS